MNGRKLIAVLLAVGVVIGLGVIVWAPGDGDDAEAPTTTTPEPTTTPPATTPAPTTTTTPTATSTPTATTTETPTTTTDPQPSFAVHVEPVPDTVYQRQFPIAIKVTNTGPTGEYSGLLSIDRDSGDHYDATVQVGGDVGANGVRWFNYTAQVGATGTYTVTLDNETVGTVDVQGWSDTDDDGTSSIDPAVNGSVDGEASAG